MEENQELDSLKSEESKLAAHVTESSEQQKSSPAEHNSAGIQSERLAPKLTLAKLFQEGQPGGLVTLPEWNGFWFKAQGEVFVFTKDNDILNTPHYEEFGERLDYLAIERGSEKTFDLMVRFVKANRVRLDLIKNKIEQYVSRNRETSIAITSLQTAFMWLGLELGEIGAANPYPKSMDASSPVIEKHTDLSEATEPMLMSPLDGLDETGMVKALRLEIQRSINILRFYSNTNIIDKKFVPAAYPTLYAVDRELVNAKLWLGQQLNNIRVEQEKATTE